MVWIFTHLLFTRNSAVPCLKTAVQCTMHDSYNFITIIMYSINFINKKGNKNNNNNNSNKKVYVLGKQEYLILRICQFCLDDPYLFYMEMHIFLVMFVFLFVWTWAYSKHQNPVLGKWLMRYLSKNLIQFDKTINNFLVYCHCAKYVISSSFIGI